MMDRNRDARRGSMAAVNGSGGGLSRRRQQRSTNLRDSPEEDGATEMQESSRLRDRGVKKDRDWDRERDRSSSRSKRRRGERLMHGSNREEGDDSSEESVEDDDDEEEEDASAAVRLPAAANSSAMPSSSSLIQQQNHHHVRKSGFSASKPVRPPAAAWKVADEMIGVSIPRKARTSSLKRPQEYSVSGGGGSGELIHRQASTSPARPSPSSTPAISPPSSSNASVRKKKPISGTKHRPPKMVKSPPTIQEIEIEVAEVLYGMTRQAPLPATSKQEGNKVDSKDTIGVSNDTKSRVSSPNSISQTPDTSQPSVAPSSNLPMVATAPKRKRPRLRFDEESPTSPASSVAPSNKMVSEMPQKTEEATSPRSEKNTSASPAVENVIGSGDSGGPVNTQQDLAMSETGNQGSADDVGDQGKVKEEVAALSSKSKEASCVESNVNAQEATAATAATKAVPANEGPREEKFSIDLMALPIPEKSFSDRDGPSDFVPDHKSIGPEKKEIANGEVEKVEKASKHEGTSGRQNAEHFLSDEFELKKQTSKEKIPDLQLDLEKHDKEGLSLNCSNKQQQQQLVPKQQQKSGRMEPKQEKPAPSVTLPLPMPIAGWPIPPFGYMGQVPSLPMDGNSGAAKTVQQPPQSLQPQMRPKRCATHCYIAQNIAYHQLQISRMNTFWSAPAAAAAAAAAAAVGVAPLYGAKQYNLNAMPPSESAAILGNPLHGGFPPRSMGPLHDKSAPAVSMAYTVPPPKENNSLTAAANSNNYVEAAQWKQLLLQQNPQPGSMAAPPNMMHGPAFIFQPAMANRPGGPSKSTPGTTGSAAPTASSAAVAGSGAAGHPATTVSFNYAGLSPSDAQYMAILQNNAYPFPIAAAQIGAPPAYRGPSPAQAMPFFNGPFYSSQMFPSQQQQQQLMQQQQQHQQQQHRQQQQQQQPPPAHSKQGHQNTSTSSGSSSSQKHTQQSQRVPGSGSSVAPPAGSNSHGFPASKHLHLLPDQARQLESETGCEDSPSTADSSRASQAQKGICGQNFALPMHSQNFALISPAAAAFAAGGSHSESKQSGAHQHQAVKMELTPSQAQAAQAYAMSFASFTGSAAAAQGFDFSSIVQNPVLMQNLTEGAKHGYPIPAAAVAAAAAAQAAQHKKGHHEEGKSGGDSMAANANVATEEVKTTAAGGGKNAGSVGGQHTLGFSRPDNDPTIPNFTTILADGCHRMLNGGLPMIPPSSAALTSTSAAVATSSLSSQQSQQQQMIQFQKQNHRFVQLQQQHQHQHLQLQQQMSSSRPSKSSAAHTGSSNVSSDRLPAGSATMASRFPQGGLAGFPPSLIQGSSGGSAQSPHWKTSGRAATPAPASSATSSSSSAKNQMPQQQQRPSRIEQQQRPSRIEQQPLHSPGAHQTQISFGVTTSNKPSSNQPHSSATATAIAAGSPQNSVSKSSAVAGAIASSGSPRASSSSKSGQPPASVLPTLPLQQQQSAAAAAAAAKNSLSAASGLKSSPITNNNRNMASILGHPHITPSNSSSNKLQQQQQSQQQQQQLQKQSYQQPQLFFNNAYIQAPTPQSNAAAAGYFQQQRRQSEQQQQQQNSTTSGMLTLCPSSLTLSGANASTDPAKAAAAAAASGIKGMPAPTQAGILQHTAQYTAATSMAPHRFMSAAFSYINTMPSSASVKPLSAAATDQKQSTTGNENMPACWKPEKR